MQESIAIISDIHSNSLALEAVLKDISAREIHQVVNLGDSLFGPIDPLGTARLLMENQTIIHIMGNCDQILLEAYSPSATFQFVKPFLNTDIENWIRSSYQATWRCDDLLFCHGTPFVNDKYLLEDVDENGVRLKDPNELMIELGNITQSFIFCGHSHVFKSINLPNGKLIVNAGSVGLPAYDDELPFPHVMESGTPYAEYVIAHRTNQCMSIEHVMIDYDWERASRIASENGREDYAFAIKTGRSLLK
ncbi:metallophosphoesterase family protein [Paenibacillus terrigena]|uniref:metallophosphoesterase family protein n=1 Tax=Paenibacillus terrigena TaxID=369333 RepID=UPI0003662AB8|nr:metallophosphoesterase family protein [Paenibacillus terrigena]